MSQDSVTTFIKLISKFLKRIFRYPVQRQPLCYVMQEHYDSMGRLRPADQRPKRPVNYRLNEMERVEERFYAHLRAARRLRFELSRSRTRHERPEHRYRSVLRDATPWPGWAVCTLQYLYNLFLMYFNRENGLLEEEKASALSVELGDRSPTYVRRARFINADADHDGWITFEELLKLLYNAEGPVYDHQVVTGAGGQEESASGALKPLARNCLYLSLCAETLATMPAQEQIRYGFL